MAMFVQHNLTAMNSNRMLGLTTKTQAKSTEKLSSGYKINRAADDAAGLSISEKMRKQIRGLTQASLNAQDGISSVQTAEGALTEVHDMLQRMNELAVKAANETNSESDRQSIQDEVDQLVTEINRVSETTKFNEIYLLKGDQNNQTSIDFKYNNATEATLKAGTTLYTKNAGVYSPIANDAALKTALDANETIYSAQASDGTKTGATDVETVTAFTAPAATINGSSSSGTTTGTTIVYDLSQAKTSDTITIGGQTIAVDGTTISDADGWGNAIVAQEATIIAGDTTHSIIGVSYNEDTNELTIETRAVGDYAKDDILKADGTVAYKKGDLINVPADATAIKSGNVDTNTFYQKGKAPTKEIEAVAGTDYTEAVPAALYDKDGNKVAENGLYEYFDDKGIYKGGLYATDTGAKGGVEALTKDEVATLVDTTNMKADGVLSFDLQVGADSAKGNQITVNLESMSAESIGVANLKVDGKDNIHAKDAIETVKAAIQQVSKQRSALGAVQNRLDHTINNLDNIVENTTSAESQIRDTDMATEMVKYSNNNILAQAGQAMLAQANQSNQGVLGLLG